jgi:hypothetical protein
MEISMLLLVAPMATIVADVIVWQGHGKALQRKCRDGVTTPPGSLDVNFLVTSV